MPPQPPEVRVHVATHEEVSRLTGPRAPFTSARGNTARPPLLERAAWDQASEVLVANGSGRWMGAYRIVRLHTALERFGADEVSRRYARLGVDAAVTEFGPERVCVFERMELAHFGGTSRAALALVRAAVRSVLQTGQRLAFTRCFDSVADFYWRAAAFSPCGPPYDVGEDERERPLVCALRDHDAWQACGSPLRDVVLAYPDDDEARGFRVTTRMAAE